MAEFTRRALLGSIGIAVATAGCTTERGPGRETDDPTAGDSPTESSTPGGSPGSITYGSDVPHPDHSVYLENMDGRERTVRVRVSREADDEVVYDQEQTIAPDTDREVYNLEQADPDGIESFRICGERIDPPETSDESSPSETRDSPYGDCVTIKTDRCHGHAHVTVEEGGEVRVIYSIC